ncbi:hypothetical protein HZ326_23824 [Fusarium oxysporum f. sp. albedinis]|nr:hypothetical protein HZ326_23824 [Fusarium oxysporum f. sp. albedinis]
MARVGRTTFSLASLTVFRVSCESTVHSLAAWTLDLISRIKYIKGRFGCRPNPGMAAPMIHHRTMTFEAKCQRYGSSKLHNRLMPKIHN